MAQRTRPDVLLPRRVDRGAERPPKRRTGTAVEIRDITWEALAVDCLALVHLVCGDASRAIQVADRAIEMYQKGTWESTAIYVRNVLWLLAVRNCSGFDDAIPIPAPSVGRGPNV